MVKSPWTKDGNVFCLFFYKFHKKCFSIDYHQHSKKNVEKVLHGFEKGGNVQAEEGRKQEISIIFHCKL